MVLKYKYSKISLRDVALNFSPSGNITRDMRLRSLAELLHPNCSRWSQLLISITLNAIEKGFLPTHNNQESFDKNSLVEENNNFKEKFSNINELHWTHMPLTYRYNSSCYSPIISRIELAFEIITNKTDSFVRFEKVEGDADTNFFCYPSQNVEALIYQDTTEYTYG